MSLLSGQDAMPLSLLMSLLKDFFNRLEDYYHSLYFFDKALTGKLRNHLKTYL
jgi:hypothetical protein